MDAEGNPQHPGAIAAQLELALDNLEAVLANVDMTFAHVVRLNFFTTDVDELLTQFGTVNNRLGTIATRPACSALHNYKPKFLVMVKPPRLTEQRSRAGTIGGFERLHP